MELLCLYVRGSTCGSPLIRSSHELCHSYLPYEIILYKATTFPWHFLHIPIPKYCATAWCSRWQRGAWLHVYRHTIYFFMRTHFQCVHIYTGSPSWATVMTITLYSDIWYHRDKPLSGGGSGSEHLRDFSPAWPTWLHCTINGLPHKVVLHVCSMPSCIYVRTSNVQYMLQYTCSIRRPWMKKLVCATPCY